MSAPARGTLPGMNSFPTELRRLRVRASLGQLALAAEGGVSARHLAWLETSRAMVLRLAQALEGPPAAVNGLMPAAGFAPVHPQSPLDGAALAPVREGFARMLTAHDPFAGFLPDRTWRRVAPDAAAEALFGALGLGAGDSLLALVADPDRPVAGRASARRGRPARPGADHRPVAGRGAADAVIDAGAGRGAVDPTLADLRLEPMFPADAASRVALEAQAPRQIQPPPNTRVPPGSGS